MTEQAIVVGRAQLDEEPGHDVQGGDISVANIAVSVLSISFRSD